MHESFHKKVAPPLLYTLSVLEKIESSDGAMPPPAAIRPRLKQLIGQFNVRGHDEEMHQLAKSALVFWIDEVLVNSGWQHAGEWRNHPLELETYGTRSRAWRFFENAGQARGLECPDALEVFALCVANGFQGVYRSNVVGMEAMPAAAAAESRERSAAGGEGESAGAATGGNAGMSAAGDLPPTLDEWTASVFNQLLEDRLGPFASSSPYGSTRTARPLLGRQSLMRWSAALLATGILTAATFLLGGQTF